MAEGYSREAILKRLESKGIEISPKGIEKAAREGKISPDFYEAAMFVVPFDLTSYGPAKLKGKSTRPPQIPVRERKDSEGNYGPLYTPEEVTYMKNRFLDLFEEMFFGEGIPARFNMEAERDAENREFIRQYDEEQERSLRSRAEQEALEAEALGEAVLPEIPEDGDAPGGGL